MENLINNDKLFNLKNININDTNFQYCENVLISLGLTKDFILFNNHYFFGFNDIDNQEIIDQNFKKILKVFEVFTNKLYKKYSCEQIILFLGSIYSKLEEIRIMNSNLKLENITDEDILREITYPCSVADLMGRKIKSMIETVILKDNKKICFNIRNRYYKRFVILLYYYSIFTFYSSRNKLSQNYENGTSTFQIFPNDIDSISTVVPNMNNSTNKNNSYINYDSGLYKEENKSFNNAFRTEKGISFQNYCNLMSGLVNSSTQKDLVKSKISKEEFDSILLNTYKDIDLNLFHKECILTKYNIDINMKELYKNSGKYRLDTVPIIDIGKDYYIIVKGFIINSRNYWNDVHSIGLVPYICKTKDNILIEVEKIIENISRLFETDVLKIFESIIQNRTVFTNIKSQDIFGKNKMDDNEWDIIVVDCDKHIIFDIEAKFISTSLTESRLSNDLKKFVKSKKGYIEKFEKRIRIEKENLDDFITFCEADTSYIIEHIMVTSKAMELNIESPNRIFKIIHFAGLKNYLINSYYSK